MTHPRTSSTAAKNKKFTAVDPAPQGRLREREPVAVIDIGSNSVRQVIYEGLTRAPSVLFNEKVLCGLGRGLATTSNLDPEAIDRAIRAVRRFLALGRQAGVSQTYVLATAAARDAANGPDFIARVEKIIGETVTVLTGEMEARYAAWGVACGFHRPNGIVGDMGGGSVELVRIGDGLQSPVSLPVGGLRLAEDADQSLKKADKIVRAAFKTIPPEIKNQDGVFYAVGGTWRSLAKLHMAQTKYPLSVLHAYEIDATSFRKFCDKVASDDLSSLEGIDAVSKNRRQLLPYGALVMSEIIRVTKVKRMSISSLGVREGFLYTLLPPEEQEKDPLLEAARELDVLRARSPGHALEMAEWTSAAFETLGVDETLDEKRYRIASCYLADIAWRAHSDFRAEQSLGIISNAVFAGISHEGRAHMALANYRRHVGLSSKTPPPELVSLCSDRVRHRARLLAAMFRVLYLFSASMKGVIPRIGFRHFRDQVYHLIVPADLEGLVGERPENRIQQFAREAGVEIEIRVA